MVYFLYSLSIILLVRGTFTAPIVKCGWFRKPQSQRVGKNTDDDDSKLRHKFWPDHLPFTFASSSRPTEQFIIQPHRRGKERQESERKALMRPPSIRLLSIFDQSIDQHFYGVTLVERYAHSDSKREISPAKSSQSCSHVRPMGELSAFRPARQSEAVANKQDLSVKRGFDSINP